MPLLLAICGDYGSSHPDGHMREPEFTARNFHSAQFSFPLYQVMREYASVLGVWLRSDSYSIQAHTIVLARVIGLDDALIRLQMIGQMLIERMA